MLVETDNFGARKAEEGLETGSALRRLRACLDNDNAGKGERTPERNGLFGRERPELRWRALEQLDAARFAEFPS